LRQIRSVGLILRQAVREAIEVLIKVVHNSWFQLASARQLGSESVSIAIVSSDRSARVFN